MPAPFSNSKSHFSCSGCSSAISLPRGISAKRFQRRGFGGELWKERFQRRSFEGEVSKEKFRGRSFSGKVSTKKFQLRGFNEELQRSRYSEEVSKKKNAYDEILSRDSYSGELLTRDSNRGIQPWNPSNFSTRQDVKGSLQKNLLSARDLVSCRLECRS